MSHEPMFNIPERAPMVLAGVMIGLHLIISIAPNDLAVLIRNWALLVPLDFPGVSLDRQFFSLLGAGFLHGSWTHVLVNSGMMIAFGVITMRGIRARIEAMRFESRKPLLSAAQAFTFIFLFGIIGGNLFQWGWWAATDTLQAVALGTNGGFSALFAAAAWAMGGRDQLIKYAGGWLLFNVILIMAAPIIGPVFWAMHIGGFIIGAMLAPHLVRPFSTGFSITR